MIQDIYPSRLKNEYRNEVMKDEDALFIFNTEGKVFLKNEEGQIVFPSGKDMKECEAQVPAGEAAGGAVRPIYLFAVDDTRYFLARGSAGLQKEGFGPYSVREVRDDFGGKEVYAVFTAYHLWRWYSDNVYCGRCASALEPDTKERALSCPACGNIIYPRINPAVIVGVKKGDCLLITRYRRGYSNNALVAGFTEIGETLEETVAREVMEETGVKVKNIKYYKSQPWGMAQDILTGFYCEADGDGQITMDQNELKYAEWVKRENIVLQPNNLSLTNEMMCRFKEGLEL